ncbi:NAD(P)-binding protein [Hysterangium stoloniferum]|nr:NAD(P)-binding protein [Hysterangium stoloniferum]
MCRKIIFVIGSTGRQGRALIISLLTSSFTRYSFHIIALTRTPKSSAAKSLVSLADSIPGSRLTLVKGNLDDKESIRRIFEDHTIWGVFSIGVPSGTSGEQEQQRGVMLVDLSVEYGVQRYIFSSIERGGEVHDDDLAIELNQGAKVNIERHIMSINSEHFKWTILRTGFFMENFDGTSGKIVAGALRCGLQSATRIQLIAIDDIGHISAAIFQSPELFINTVLTVFGDAVTYDQLNAVHSFCAAGRQLPSVPDMIAKPLLTFNAHIRGLCV